MTALPNSTNRMNIHHMVTAALLCAIGILIPLVSPVRILLEPMSFTLASHVAIFFAMFLSPGIAVFVALGTTLGFLLSMPLVIAARAASHIVFTVIGALYIRRNPQVLLHMGKALIFSLVIALIHAACEVLSVIPFYFSNALKEGYYTKGFTQSVLGLVGVGTIAHSMVDFALALLIYRPMRHMLARRFPNARAHE